jgi:hypothetical protein
MIANTLPSAATCLNALKPGDDELEAVRQCARESSAQYRER